MPTTTARTRAVPPRRRAYAALVALLLAPLGAASANPDSQIDALLQARFDGDRTGACAVAAIVEQQSLRTGRYCARAAAEAPTEASRFEIGSVSKTMLAALVAIRINEGSWALDDPILKHLPAVAPTDARVARITVEHLLTHSAGLPPLPPTMRPADPLDPYAGLSSADLLEGLRVVTLLAEPGTRSEYSNFGMLLLSLILSRAVDASFVQTAERELFTPLKMADTGAASSLRTTQGHDASGHAVPNWTIDPSLAGAGFVRSTLGDMARYLRAQITAGDEPLAKALRRSRQPLRAGHAMAWRQQSIAGRRLSLHDGATGGFSSFAAIDEEANRAVVVLADTSLGDLGGLGDVGLKLLGLEVPVAQPRRPVPAPAALKRALAGDWQIGGMPVRIRESGAGLTIQGATGPAVELLFDSQGDFHPAQGSGVLTARLQGDRLDSFLWRQSGALLTATRRDAAASGPPVASFAEAAGFYNLLPGFDLEVIVESGRLRLQATGQQAIDAQPTGQDQIAAPAVGLTIRFTRNSSGSIDGLVLTQSGQTLRGTRR